MMHAVRVQAADRYSACMLAAASCSRQDVFSGKVSPSFALNGHRAVTRQYSSDSKDDLRVRYLDGEDSGKFGAKSPPVKMLLIFLDGECGVIVRVSTPRALTVTWSTVTLEIQSPSGSPS